MIFVNLEYQRLDWTVPIHFPLLLSYQQAKNIRLPRYADPPIHHRSSFFYLSRLQNRENND